MQRMDKSDWRFHFDEHKYGDQVARPHAGWRIESKYQNGVLVNNWAEERYNFLKFPHGKLKHKSAYQIEYQPFNVRECGPDVTQRRKAILHNEGLPAENFTRHHGDQYLNNNVSLYDEDYNGRWREKGLPDLRSWNSKHIAWLPERSDYHVKEGPTNFGLLGEKQELWKRREREAASGEYDTNYNRSYTRHAPNEYMNKRFGIDKEKSSRFLPTNQILKDIRLRGKPCLSIPQTIVYPESTLPKIVS